MQCDGPGDARGLVGLGYMKFLFYLNVIICLNKKMLIMMSSGNVSEQKTKTQKQKTKKVKKVKKKVKNESSCA